MGLCCDPSSVSSTFEASDSPESSMIPTRCIRNMGNHDLVNDVPREPSCGSHRSVLVVLLGIFDTLVLGEFLEFSSGC